MTVKKSRLLLSLGLISSNLNWAKHLNTSFLQGLFISEDSKVHICSVLLIFIAQMETNSDMYVGTCASCSAGQGFVCLGVFENPLSCSQGNSCNTWHSTLTVLKFTSLFLLQQESKRKHWILIPKVMISFISRIKGWCGYIWDGFLTVAIAKMPFLWWKFQHSDLKNQIPQRLKCQLVC